jgi:hypothetical protein
MGGEALERDQKAGMQHVVLAKVGEHDASIFGELAPEGGAGIRAPTHAHLGLGHLRQGRIHVDRGRVRTSKSQEWGLHQLSLGGEAARQVLCELADAPFRNHQHRNIPDEERRN